MSGKAIVHVKTVRTKTTDRIIGFRLEAAVPNLEGRVMRMYGEDFYATQQVAPSFRGKYLIAESSDYATIGNSQLLRFLDSLKWNGYSSFEYFGKYNGEPLSVLADSFGL